MGSTGGAAARGGAAGGGDGKMSASLSKGNMRKVQSFTGDDGEAKARAWAQSEKPRSGASAEGGSSPTAGGMAPVPAASRRNSMATYSGASSKSSGFQRKVVEIARQMKAAMEAEEAAEQKESTGGADVFRRRRGRARTHGHGAGVGDELVIEDRAGGEGQGPAGRGADPMPGDRLDPGTEPLTSWRQVELQDRDVVGMAGQLGLPASKVSDVRAAMNEILQQQITERLRRKQRGGRGRGGRRPGGSSSSGKSSKGGVSRNQDKLRKRGPLSGKQKPSSGPPGANGRPGTRPPPAPEEGGTSTTGSSTGGSRRGGIAGSSSLRRGGGGGGGSSSTSTSQVQGMLPGRRYEQGPGGGAGSGSASRVGTVKATVGGRFGMGLDIPQFHS